MRSIPPFARAAALLALIAVESFAYWGVRAILALMLTGPLERGGLAVSRADAGDILSTFRYAALLAPLVGGILGALLTPRAALGTGAAIMCASFAWMAGMGGAALPIGLE